MYVNAPFKLEQLQEFCENIVEAKQRRIIPLLLAAETDHVHAIDLLVTLGADVNLRDSEGRTASFIAAEYGKFKALKKLGDLHADINQPDFRGVNPVSVAAEKGYGKTVDTLVSLGADMNAEKKSSHFPRFFNSGEAAVAESNETSATKPAPA